MSTALNTNGQTLEIPIASDYQKSKTYHIITAQWNSHITSRLRNGAMEVFAKAGIPTEHILMTDVPGTVELINPAARVIRNSGEDEKIGAVIIIGCVIRGDTPHFDYVCQIAAQGTATLNALGLAPVIFGVLTVDNEQQALDRAGGRLGNKGAEAALTALVVS